MPVKSAIGHSLAQLGRALPGLLGPGRLFERLRWRLSMVAYRLLGESGDERRSVRCRNGALMELTLSEYVDRSIYCTGEWEPRESELFRARLRSGDCVVDAGAYIGWFALLAGRLVGPMGQVLAFEANPATYERLQGNLALNAADNVTAYNCALGDVPGRVRIGSRTQGNSGGDFVDFEIVDGQGDVDVVLLDEVLGDRTVRLVKIDIEGAEAKALRGARQLLLRSDAPDLILEFTPEFIRLAGDDPGEVVALLRESGYQLLLILPGALVEAPADVAGGGQSYLYCTKSRQDV